MSTLSPLPRSPKRVAILQSNYIPWKGYFDLINMADEFILFDDMQFTKRDWRNRNVIKTRNGLVWLTIPVQVKGKYFQRISETMIDDPAWAERHWSSIIHAYAKAPHFGDYRKVFEPLFGECEERSLSRVNFRFIEAICRLLGIKTKLSWSMDYQSVEGKTERLVSLCQQSGASEYISGPAARSYIVSDMFREAGISLRYIDYAGYREYHQLYPPFAHGVSILDLLFNEGPHAATYMKSF